MLKKIRFDELVRLNRGFDLPDSKVVNGIYPVVASTSIKTYHNEYKIEPPVVVTGRSGSLGKVQYIEEKCWPLNTSLYSKDFRENYPLYVYYYLKTMHLEQYNAGAGVPTLNQNHLQKLKILVHAREEQEKIADMLFVYDKNIEINSKRIRLLEQMAENLYKEWFVRFRFPGYENTEFESGIPNWDLCKVDDIVDIKAGGDRPSICVAEKNDTCNIPIYSNGIENDGLYGYTTEPVVIKEGITISARGTVGYVCLHRKPFVPIVRLLALTPKYEWLDAVYLFYLFKYDTIIGNGTSQQQITVPMVKRKKVLLPPNKLINNFSKYATDIWNQIDILKEQNEILSKQRDLLLPRLMSGKLEVK